MQELHTPERAVDMSQSSHRTVTEAKRTDMHGGPRATEFPTGLAKSVARSFLLIQLGLTRGAGIDLLGIAARIRWQIRWRWRRSHDRARVAATVAVPCVATCFTEVGSAAIPLGDHCVAASFPRRRIVQIVTRIGSSSSPSCTSATSTASAGGGRRGSTTTCGGRRRG